MASVEDFYSEVRRSARGIPEPMLRDAIVRAARIFCRESWYVRRYVLITTVAGQSNYEITDTQNEDAINVLRGQVQDIATPPNIGEIRPLLSVETARINPNLYINPSKPRWYGYAPVNTLILYPTPDNAYMVTVVVPVQPVKGGTYIPDELLQDYEDTIGQGALMWLYRMRTAEWFDPNEAARCEMEFNRGWTKAKTIALRDFKVGIQRANAVNITGRNWLYWNTNSDRIR